MELGIHTLETVISALRYGFYSSVPGVGSSLHRVFAGCRKDWQDVLWDLLDSPYDAKNDRQGHLSRGTGTARKALGIGTPVIHFGIGGSLVVYGSGSEITSSWEGVSILVWLKVEAFTRWGSSISYD